MPTQDFYSAVKQHIYNAKQPFSIVFTKLSFDKNKGGERRTLENQLPGPLRKNMNDRFMIGLQDMLTDKVLHIYLHTILEIINFEGQHIKLKL